MGSARDAPSPRLHGLAARRQVSVQQLDSEVRRPGGPRDPAPPAVGVAGGSRTPDSDGTDEHSPATRTVASSEPHTGSSPLASSPGPATEFDLPTRAGRPRYVPPTTGSPDHGPAPGTVRGLPPTPKVEYRRPVPPCFPLTLTRSAHSLDLAATRLTSSFSAARHHSPEWSRAEETDTIFRDHR